MKKILWRVAALMAALMLLTTAAFAIEPAETMQIVSEKTADVTQEAPVSEGDPTAPEEPDWRLLLVNPWNPVPENFSVELRRLSNGLQVDARIFDALDWMLADCRAAGLRPVICSAYRTEATQARLHRNKIARLVVSGWPREAAPQEASRWVAAPGTSEHQTGLALDIVSASYQVLNHRQAETAEQKWLMEHCWRYGFILRYPADKTEITGIGYEPWHYRYVGREAALAIRDNGLCFEEYLETLKAPAEPAPEVPAEAPAETAEGLQTADADAKALLEVSVSVETEKIAEEERPTDSLEKKGATGRHLIVKPPKNS